MIGAIADVGATFGRWRTWWLLAGQDIQMRYMRSVIGPFWITLAMAALIFGMALLYGGLFNQNFSEYLFYLSCGFLTWFFLQAMVIDASGLVMEAENHLRAIRIPVPVFAARMVARNLIIFLHNAVVVAGVMIYYQFPVNQQTALAIPGLLVLIGIGYFWAITIAPICARFRDIPQVIASVLQIAFFLTPIFWRADQGGVRGEFVMFNPLYHLIELVRAPLHGVAPTELNWIVALSVLGGLVVTALITQATTRRQLFLWL